MNLAILIGVSEYKDPSNNLPACKKDIDLMHREVDPKGWTA